MHGQVADMVQPENVVVHDALNQNEQPLAHEDEAGESPRNPLLLRRFRDEGLVLLDNVQVALSLDNHYRGGNLARPRG